MNQFYHILRLPVIITSILIILINIFAMKSHTSILGGIFNLGILFFLFYSVKNNSVKNGFKSLKKISIILLLLCLADDVFAFPIGFLAIKKSFFITIPLALLLLIYLSNLIIIIIKTTQ